MKTPHESELHAVADGGLEPERLAEVQAWLAKHPGEAARIGSWRTQKEAMHAYFDPILDAPIPAHLLRATKPDPKLWPMIVGAIVCLAIGAAGGYATHAPMPANITIATGKGGSIASLPQQAAAAHAVYAPDQQHPVELGAEQEAALTAWLSARLGGSIAIPQLAPLGHRLLGGRVLPDIHKPAAQLMYQDGAGSRLTLYLRQDGEHSAAEPRLSRQGKLNVMSWDDGSLGYAVTSDKPGEQLQSVVQALRKTPIKK